ncbi:MAG: HDOD domain-containing protein [Usitatibacteraceae bacterium]
MEVPHQRAVVHAHSLINAKRQYGGMRIVIDNRGVSEADLSATLHMVSEANADATHPLIVAFTDASALIALQGWQPPPNAYPEFNHDWLAQAEARAMLVEGKFPHWSLNGTPAEALDAALKKSLVYSVGPGAGKRIAGKASVRTGVRTHVDADTAFGLGIDWIAGWPLQAPDTSGNRRSGDNRTITIRLMQLAQSDADISEIDKLLRQDSALAFKLLRSINSAAVGLSVQVQSFQHAVMILGYQRLARWLAVLLMSSGDGPNQLPLSKLALRRGFFVERIVRLVFAEGNPDEPFMVGLFSLLDLILGRPFSELLGQLHLADAVANSLRDHGEPYGPLLKLAEAIESDDAVAIREYTQSLGLDSGDVNRAVLMAIRDADRVELA